MKLFYFGSFSPIHNGHLHQVRLCVEKGYDVEIVVSPHNPEKDPNVLLPIDLRIDMIEKGLKELGLKANVNLIELTLPTPNYTYITLRKLQETYGDIAILIGTDTVNNIRNWKNYNEVKNYKFIESIRPGYVKDNGEINIIDQIDGSDSTSSTEIRELMKEGKYDEVKEKMPISSFNTYLEYGKVG